LTLICDYSLNLDSILLKFLIVDYNISIWGTNIRTQSMVVIQEHKTYFVRSRLHLPHVLGEMEPTGTFCHITSVNMNGVKWKWKNATHFKFLYIKDCLFVAAEMDWVNLSVFWLQSNSCFCFTCKLTSNIYSWHMTPLYSAAVGLILTLLWHYHIAKVFWREWKVSQWFRCSFRHKECCCTGVRVVTTREYLFSCECSVTVLLKTYIPVT
jgi:hypothetical protein